MKMAKMSNNFSKMRKISRTIKIYYITRQCNPDMQVTDPDVEGPIFRS